MVESTGYNARKLQRHGEFHLAKAYGRFPSHFSSSTVLAAIMCAVLIAPLQMGQAQSLDLSFPRSPHRVSRLIKGTPMPSTAPLYLESETYTSTLYLVNQIKEGVEADVTLYDMSGALLTTKRLYLGSNSQQATSIRKVLSDGGLFSQAGSVEVLTPTHTSAVLGQLSITRKGLSADAGKAYLDEELFMPEKGGSQTLRSVIDSPENSPIVAVTNVSPTATQTIKVTCVRSAGARVDKTVNLQPKQTKLVRACSPLADSAFSADEVDSQFVLKPELSAGFSGQRVAGITLTTDGPPGELAVFGFVAHSDSFGNYFSAANFADLHDLHSSGFVFAGVPVGPMRGLSGIRYTPQVALTNFSSIPQTVTVLLATTEDGKSGMKQVASTPMAAGSSKLLSLPELNGGGDWQNSFVVRSSGQPGDVMAKMMFKGAGKLPNIELIGKDEHDPHTAGDHPWTTEDGTRSVLVLFNHSTQVKSVSVRIGAPGSVWLKSYDLQPNETRTISIGDVVASGAKDVNGFVMAKTLISGEVGWWSPSMTSPEVSGRVVQMDSEGASARNFSCGDYLFLCDIAFSENLLSVPVGGTTTNPDAITFCSENEGEAPTVCPMGGEPTTQQIQITPTYSSGNTSIATVSPTDYEHSSTWTGKSKGWTQGYISACAVWTWNNSPNNCCEGSGPVESTGCQVPSGEVSSDARQTVFPPGGPTTTDFLQTLYTSGSDGATIIEAENAPGTDSCYYPQSAILPVTSVTGGTWIVGEITPGFLESQLTIPRPGQWGPNIVGWFPSSVRYYQQNRPPRKLTLPCGFKASQQLTIICPGQDATVFDAYVPLSSSIDSTGLTNCREGVCSGHNLYH